MTLEQAADRVKLLKAGIPGKCIENRYLKETGTRIIGGNQYQPPRSTIQLIKEAPQ